MLRWFLPKKRAPRTLYGWSACGAASPKPSGRLAKAYVNERREAVRQAGLAPNRP